MAELVKAQVLYAKRLGSEFEFPWKKKISLFAYCSVWVCCSPFLLTYKRGPTVLFLQKKIFNSIYVNARKLCFYVVFISENTQIIKCREPYKV